MYKFNSLLWEIVVAFAQYQMRTGFCNTLAFSSGNLAIWNSMIWIISISFIYLFQCSSGLLQPLKWEFHFLPPPLLFFLLFTVMGISGFLVICYSKMWFYSLFFNIIIRLSRNDLLIIRLLRNDLLCCWEVIYYHYFLFYCTVFHFQPKIQHWVSCNLITSFTEYLQSQTTQISETIGY